LVPGLPRVALLAVLIAVSIASGTFILTFAIAKESVPAHLGGSISGIANMGVMLGGMFMQPLVGYVLDLNWSGRIDNGVRVYDFDAWRRAFASMLVWGLASLAMMALIRETWCRPQGSARAN
ncbi:MAG TPA: hypothetical protein VFP36_03515, partial [Usitatibacter sp.]|nr:hypothetical protein [Usitatibacter sp.]